MYQAPLGTATHANNREDMSSSPSSLLPGPPKTIYSRREKVNIICSPASLTEMFKNQNEFTKHSHTCEQYNPM